MNGMSIGSAASELDGGSLGFLRRLQECLGRSAVPSGATGIIVAQLANLSQINTTAGYGNGHRASVAFARRVEDMLRSDDWMCVIGDDRVGVVLNPVHNTGHLTLAANRIARIASGTPIPNGNGLELEVRVGLAMYPEHGATPERLLRSADLALETAAKRQAMFAIYTPEDSQSLTDEWDLSTEIAAGLEDGEFELRFQPKVTASTLEPTGAETLLRWNNPRLGPVPPQRFIDVADGTEQIDELSRFVLHGAAQAATAWPGTDLTVAVNLTPSTLESGSIAHELESAAAIWGMEMNRFTVEITENGVVAAGGNALSALEALRDVGVRVSIDDFGTGNSSLAYFKNIPADELKIDKSFVIDMHQSESSTRLVRTIIDLAHSFGLTVVAEGVESEVVARKLQELGCDVLQGYYFARPLPQSEFVEFLLARRSHAQLAR